MIDFNYYTLNEARNATGVVVVIDVLRAFTTAAHAFDVGAIKILPVAGVDEAVQLRKEIPGSLIMGEVDGEKPAGFDFGNSPTAISELDLSGRILIQRTSAGTQGIVSALNADQVLAASFVVAKPTAEVILRFNPAVVSFVITGESMGRDGDEDRACAEYIQEMVKGETPDPAFFIQRVSRSTAGRSFLMKNDQSTLPKDLNLSIQANGFPFALPVKREESKWVMYSEKAK